MNRYRIGADGKTLFSRVTGINCLRTIAEFGEQILFKPSSKRNPSKAETESREGTFLGLKARTSEAYVATADGSVVTCRTIRARPPAERWSAEKVIGVNPGSRLAAPE